MTVSLDLERALRTTHDNVKFNIYLCTILSFNWLKFRLYFVSIFTYAYLFHRVKQINTIYQYKFVKEI